MELELNHRRKLFIANFLESRNASSAAIQAGYSFSSAAVQGARLLGDPAVKAIIAEQMDARLQRLSISADWVLSRLKAEALDRSENSSHGARVAALSTLAKCLNLMKPETTSESKVNFVINMTPAAPNSTVIDHEP